jgi:hypothetical protein
MSLSLSLVGGNAMSQTNSANAVKNVVLVHGAFADAAGWNKVISLLHAKGLHVVSVQNSLTSFAEMLPLQGRSSPRKTAQLFRSATPTAEPCSFPTDRRCSRNRRSCGRTTLRRRPHPSRNHCSPSAGRSRFDRVDIRRRDRTALATTGSLFQPPERKHR